MESAKFKERYVAIEDEQSLEDRRCLALDKVGVRSVRYPIAFSDAGQTQQSIASFDMFVHLEAVRRGAHMSRFLEVLSQMESPLSVSNIGVLYQCIVDALVSKRVYLKMEFPFFVKKEAPVSGKSSFLDYTVTLIAEEDLKHPGQCVVTQQVLVPVTALCPCSKKVSDYGAHNQRAHVTMAVKSQPCVSIMDLIAVAERHASCELFGLLKRSDEKYVTEKAYENPKFVEDLARDVSIALREDSRISWHQVSVESFESIHNHSAYASVSHEHA